MRMGISMMESGPRIREMEEVRMRISVRETY